MSKETALTPSQKAQIEGQNLATASWPQELDARQHLIRVYLEAKEKEAHDAKKAAEEARKKVGADVHLTRLTKDYGWEKLAIDTIGKLKKVTDPEKLGRICRQIFETMKDEGMLVPELFDAGVLGMTAGKASEANDKPVFDNTPKGSQTKGIGGAAAEKPAKATTKPTPPVDLRVAAATLELNTFVSENPGVLKGAKKKKHADLTAAVEAAQALALSDPEGGKAPALDTPPSLEVPPETSGTTTGLPEVNPDAPTDAELPELPAAGTGEVGKVMAEGVAESAAHIAGQVAGEEVKVKAKRPSGAARKKAAADAKNAEEAEAKRAMEAARARDEVAGPDGPDDEDPFPPAPALPPRIGGTTPASTRLG